MFAQKTQAMFWMILSWAVPESKSRMDTSLLWLVTPPITSIFETATPKIPERKDTSVVFNLSSSGVEFKRILTEPSLITSAISLREARGMTRTAIQLPFLHL